ncbi:hypothetical protein ACF3OC_08480 [Sphingobacterium cellulitidis]|uniref:hypothetical protein n=1 Tax=Sphingobacterium cellulitidis TaxID=1768011 RepID=UPI00370D9C3D
MAVLIRTSTNLEAREVEEGTTSYLDISLKFEFVSDGDYHHYLNDDGTINNTKLLSRLIHVMNAAEEIKL